jgi:hypothetical protein
LCYDQASILQRQHQKCYLSRRQRHGNRKPRTVSRRCARHWRPPPLDTHWLTALDSSVENVQISDVAVIPANGNVENGAYIKTWIGSLQLRGPVTMHTNLEEFHGVVVGASCEIYCSRTSNSMAQIMGLPLHRIRGTMDLPTCRASCRSATLPSSILRD